MGKKREVSRVQIIPLELQNKEDIDLLKEVAFGQKRTYNHITDSISGIKNFLLVKEGKRTDVVALTAYSFYSYKEGSYALNINNKDNYNFVRKGETVDFISNNKRLQNAKLKVEAENEDNIYLEYENTIFKIPKNEIQ